MAFTPCHCVGNCLCLPTHPSIPCSYQVSVRQIHTAHYTQVLSYFQSSVVLKWLCMCVSHCYLIWAVVGKNSWIPNTFQFHELWQQAVSSHIKLYKQLNTTPVCLTWEVHIFNLDCLCRLYNAFRESLQRNAFPPLLSVGSMHLIITM